MLYVVPALALLFVLWTRGGRADTSKPAAVVPRAAAASAPSEPHGPVETVTVGLYLQNTPEIDIKTNSFTAELCVWFRWNGSIHPTLTYQITNAVNMTDLTQTAIYTDENGVAKPELLQTFHVYGRFGHPFPLGATRSTITTSRSPSRTPSIASSS